VQGRHTAEDRADAPLAEHAAHHGRHGPRRRLRVWGKEGPAAASARALPGAPSGGGEEGREGGGPGEKELGFLPVAHGSEGGEEGKARVFCRVL
jgi:hypothetical protein